MPDSGISSTASGTLPSVEVIAPGITCEWLHNHAIAKYTIRSVTRLSVDAWIAHVKQSVTAWPPDKPYLLLQDLTENSVGPTPYVRQRTQEIPNLRPELSQHIALILPQTFQGRMIQFFIQAQRDPVARIFFSIPEGLAWLQSFLPTAHALPD